MGGYTIYHTLLFSPFCSGRFSKSREERQKSKTQQQTADTQTHSRPSVALETNLEIIKIKIDLINFHLF